MIVKIFNINITIIIFDNNKIYELNYQNPFYTENKYIYGWVYFNNEKYGLIELNTKKIGFNKAKICPNSEVIYFNEKGKKITNLEKKLNLINHDFYFSPKYNSLIPEWLPSNVIQLLNFIDDKRISKVINNSKNEIELRKNLSKLAGFLYEDILSKSKIISYINTYAINMNKYKISNWNNLNEFLSRDLLKYPDFLKKNMLYSPVEGLYKIITEDNFYIKGNKFNFTSLVNKKIHFNHPILFRMLPSHYHKFHSPCKLKFNDISYIDGDLYSIRPNTIANNDCLIKNQRCVLSFTDKDDYKLYMIVIGSIFIGSIHIHKEKLNKWIEPGEELGYFKFGGSSVVLLVEKDIDFMIKNVGKYETKVELGSLIGDLKKTKNIKYNFDRSIKLPDTTKDNSIKLILEILIYLFLYFFYKKFLT